MPMMRSGLRSTWLLTTALAVLAACSSRADEDSTEGATLQIDPPTSEHLILNGAPAQQAFTATLLLRNGKQRDVTAETVFSIDSTIGTFNGNELVLGGAGKTTAF